MSAISDIFANELALLLFNNTDIPNVGDLSGIQNSATVGALFLALHTADPSDAGNASSSEATYTSYARVAVNRIVGGWAIVARNATNTADIVFPTSTLAGSEVLTHWSICKQLTGPSVILFKGSLNTALTVNINIAPRVIAGALDVNF